MNQFNTPLRRKSLGQSMMEYIIIVALIAIAAIGTYSMFGKTVRNQSAGLAKELAGKKADSAISNAASSSGSAQSRANTEKGLSEYNKDNDAK